MIYQGEDVEVDMTLTENGTSVDINTLTNLIIVLFQRDEIKAVYSLNDISYDTDGNIEVVDATNGEVRFLLDEDVTENLEAREVFLEIATSTSDSRWSDGNWDSISNGEKLVDVEESFTKEIGG